MTFIEWIMLAVLTITVPAPYGGWDEALQPGNLDHLWESTF